MGGADKEYTKAELDGFDAAKLKEIADGLGLANGAKVADILEFQKEGWTKPQLEKLSLNGLKDAAKKLRIPTAEAEAFKDNTKSQDIEKILAQNKIFKKYYKENELKADSMSVAELKKIATAKGMPDAEVALIKDDGSNKADYATKVFKLPDNKKRGAQFEEPAGPTPKTVEDNKRVIFWLQTENAVLRDKVADAEPICDTLFYLLDELARDRTPQHVALLRRCEPIRGADPRINDLYERWKEGKMDQPRRRPPPVQDDQAVEVKFYSRGELDRMALQPLKELAIKRGVKKEYRSQPELMKNEILSKQALKMKVLTQAELEAMRTDNPEQLIEVAAMRNIIPEQQRREPGWEKNVDISRLPDAINMQQKLKSTVYLPADIDGMPPDKVFEIASLRRIKYTQDMKKEELKAEILKSQVYPEQTLAAMKPQALKQVAEARGIMTTTDINVMKESIKELQEFKTSVLTPQQFRTLDAGAKAKVVKEKQLTTRTLNKDAPEEKFLTEDPEILTALCMTQVYTRKALDLMPLEDLKLTANSKLPEANRYTQDVTAAMKEAVIKVILNEQVSDPNQEEASKKNREKRKSRQSLLIDEEVFKTFPTVGVVDIKGLAPEFWMNSTQLLIGNVEIGHTFKFTATRDDSNSDIDPQSRNAIVWRPDQQGAEIGQVKLDYRKNLPNGEPFNRLTIKSIRVDNNKTTYKVIGRTEPINVFDLDKKGGLHELKILATQKSHDGQDIEVKTTKAVMHIRLDPERKLAPLPDSADPNNQL